MAQRILHLDMNISYASVEVLDNPKPAGDTAPAANIRDLLDSWKRLQAGRQDRD
jgi:nucleotidyltransferase/DNA polymerase involved in DNA repair